MGVGLHLFQVADLLTAGLKIPSAEEAGAGKVKSPLQIFF